jgi:tetratricopeptide (TPR) repeat protein
LSTPSHSAELAISCDAGVVPKFDYALMQLHSFEYPEARLRFREILDADPDCAMARWGIAMSLWQPLWAPPSIAELGAGMVILDAVDRSAINEEETLYLNAISAFFSNDDPATHVARVAMYVSAMETLYEKFPHDPDASAFYALALLALAATDPTDKTYARQYKAGSILAWVRESQPNHPGVLHYTIHSYDYPALAHLALGAATEYAGAAPDSAHAQHMPSHIFTRLGLWDQSIASNHDSTHSATEYTRRAGLAGHYDEGLHSIDYLMYAYLQTAMDDEALQLLQSLATIGKTNVDNFKVAYTYAASPARYALERHQWREASELQLFPDSFPWSEFPWARSIHHFARGIGAARSDQLELARAELEIIRELENALASITLAYWREEVFVHDALVSSWIAFADGESSAALILAATAADREDKVDKHPVTPGEVLPARELYADMLFELEKFADALEQYQRVLGNSPNRYNSLLGAARSAAAMGLEDVASEYYEALVEIAGDGGTSRESLTEAIQFLAQLLR